jgi:hypothetical protein
LYPFILNKLEESFVMKKHIERAERLPLTVKCEKALKDVRAAKSPTAAANIIATPKRPLEETLGIIDNLDPLTAAFVIAVFRERADGHLHHPLACSKAWAMELITKADRLQIRGTLGLCHARDQVYQETGFFAGS